MRYYDSSISVSFSGFLNYWSKTIFGNISGHLWFLWVLLAFNIVIVIVFKLFPKLVEHIRNTRSNILTSPMHFFILFFILSILAYWPMSGVAGGGFINVFGPFNIQISRLLMYFLYFSTGVIIGICGLNRSVFKSDGTLIKHGALLISIGLITYVLYINILISSIKTNIIWSNNLLLLLFIIICLTISFGLFGTFVGLVKKPNKLFKSLRENAFGIYIFHYSIVTVLQFIFLKINIFGGLKAFIVFLLSLTTTWLLVVLLRRIPIVSKIIG